MAGGGFISGPNQSTGIYGTSGKIETPMNQQESLITSEYAKKRTEKSPNSKLNVITRAFKDSKLSKIISNIGIKAFFLKLLEKSAQSNISFELMADSYNFSSKKDKNSSGHLLVI